MSAVEPRTVVDMCHAAARLLRDYEWHDTNVDRVDGEGYSCCPECGHAQTRGHAPDCDLDRTVTGLEAFARVERAIAGKVSS